MREQEIEKLLGEMSREEFYPSADLLQRTRQRLYATPLLRVSLFVSLGVLTLGWLAVMVALLSPDVSPQIKLVLTSCSLAGWGGTLIGLVAARNALVPFLRRLETSMRVAS